MLFLRTVFALTVLAKKQNSNRLFSLKTYFAKTTFLSKVKMKSQQYADALKALKNHNCILNNPISIKTYKVSDFYLKNINEKRTKKMFFNNISCNLKRASKLRE